MAHSPEKLKEDFFFKSLSASRRLPFVCAKERLPRPNPSPSPLISPATIFRSFGQSDSFKRIFISFKVCIGDFIVGCRYLIGVDTCHLKSKYLAYAFAKCCLGISSNNLCPSLNSQTHRDFFNPSTITTARRTVNEDMRTRSTNINKLSDMEKTNIKQKQ
ncbi:hypothetical protein M5K25_017304 [Dendrobium thyrsiflorum]|uniref:Uncharacterized protein n=1 Tax=Dendrobium thyrsiflorum TaxID=117978 RepID=A0ABD0UMH5_DENTH